MDCYVTCTQPHEFIRGYHEASTTAAHKFIRGYFGKKPKSIYLSYNILTKTKKIMSHSLCKIWVHSIFGTKHRENLILPEHEKEVHNLMLHEFNKLECRVREINGTANHVHALFLLDKKCSPSQVMKQVKGAVSNKINKINLLPNRFKWQVGYGAFSVSESRVKGVQKYIQNQKEHHRQKETLEEELIRFWKIYGMKWHRGKIRQYTHE